MRRVLTVGTFDPLHSGHLGLFRQCKRLGDHLIVGVNTDAFIQQYRGQPPMMPYKVRAEVIGALTIVDQVAQNPALGMSQASTILSLRPDILVVGQDWAVKDYPAQLGVTPDWFEQSSIQLVYVPRTGDWSSTALKEASGHACQ